MSEGIKATVGKRVRFRMAGYLFTYRRATGTTKVRIDMWREDPATGERHWVSVAACSPNAASARSVALALVAWVKSCDIAPRRTTQAQAVAESFALLREGLALLAPGSSGSVRTRVAAPVRIAPATRRGVSCGTRDVAA
jgi:hypothetical protein